jgi:fructose-bisphosphate aldolase class II
MWDGSALPLATNLAVATDLFDRCRAADVMLEIEVGVVGGEREGSTAEHPAHLYTTPDDLLAVADALGTGERGKYLLAATFGNVHGVYKPGNVRLDPAVLRIAQEAVSSKLGRDQFPFDLVFHGGSGSEIAKIHEAIDYGVVKFNVSTDAEYDYSRAIADHMFRHYDGVLKIDGEVGAKSAYDPRKYLRKAQESLAERVAETCSKLRSAGRCIG